MTTYKYFMLSIVLLSFLPTAEFVKDKENKKLKKVLVADSNAFVSNTAHLTKNIDRTRKRSSITAVKYLLETTYSPFSLSLRMLFLCMFQDSLVLRPT